MMSSDPISATCLADECTDGSSSVYGSNQKSTSSIDWELPGGDGEQGKLVYGSL